MTAEDWKYEYPLSQWVASNLDRVSEATGLPRLELVGLEIKPGSFPIDVVAATPFPSNEIVVIENQLGGGDHDHFGKLLTHAAGFGAAHAIWIAEGFSDEHIHALRTLNAFGGTTFYALSFAGRKAATIQFEEVVTPRSRVDTPAHLGESAKQKYLRIATFWRMLKDALPGAAWHPDMVSDKCLRQAVSVPGTDVWIWIEPHDECLAPGTGVSVWPGDQDRNHALLYAILDRSGLRDTMGGEYARVPEGGILPERERDWHEPIRQIANFIEKLRAAIPPLYPERTA